MGKDSGLEKWDVRLLTASYRREGPEEEPVLELFGRTRKDNNSIVVEYRGFNPYFYCVSPPPPLKAALAKDPEIVRLEDVELELEGKKTPCTRVVMKHPWRTPEYRERCRKYDSQALAADIPFPHRFIYDLDLSSCFTVHGKRIGGRYTSDLVVEAHSFELCDPFNPSLHVLSFDIENTIKDPTILCLGWVMREDGKVVKGCFSGSEKDIIESFVKLVREKDPDVITGYNIDGYDLPLLLERARANGITDLNIARDFMGISNIGDRFWRAHGRIIADAWWSVKIEIKPKQETLDAVARLLLGEGKHDVDRTRMEEEWERDKDKVMEYCVKDAELALRILEKVSRLDKSLDLATVSKLPLDDVFNGRTSQLIDSILIRAADRAKVAVPMMRTGRDVESIEGGYVHTLEAGLYEWVAVLDFRSMYPSIIIENNICFTTFNEDGTIVSPTGARFLSKDVKVGLLPAILKDLMLRREEAKANMQSASTPDRREYYARLQNAIKTLMNAFYGVLASTFYRFTNPQIGASITAFARENIKSIIEDLESQGLKVIYADTDSVFFESPHKDLNQSLEFGRRIAERFSHGSISMEFERVMRTFFSHGKKKRYAGKVVWPKEELVFRGYEIRRTDAFDLQGEAQRRVFKRILDNDIDGAIGLAKDVVQSLRRGRLPEEFIPEEGDPLELLVISRTVKEDERYVNPESMSNVQAARKLKEMGYEVVPGMKVSWIVIDAKKAPMQVHPYVSGRKFEESPDWEYYARRLAQTLSYVTEVYGWDEKSLLSGSQSPKQSTLLQRDFAPQGKKGAKKTDKPLKLEDFF